MSGGLSVLSLRSYFTKVEFIYFWDMVSCSSDWLCVCCVAETDLKFLSPPLKWCNCRHVSLYMARLDFKIVILELSVLAMCWWILDFQHLAGWGRSILSLRLPWTAKPCLKMNKWTNNQKTRNTIDSNRATYLHFSMINRIDIKVLKTFCIMFYYNSLTCY